MKTRLLLPLVAMAVLLGGCSDDGGDDTIQADPDDLTATSVEAPTESTVGPTAGGAACADLADRYVRQARRMFDVEGTPSDELVDEVRARLVTFDDIAATAGCGGEYVTGVCAGLDELALEGVLVILPLTTAQCL